MNRSDPIRWRRALLDAFVIVASILFALAAESWWQERSDRKEEQEILVALHDEFTANERVLHAQADSISTAIALLDSVVSLSGAELVSASRSTRGPEIGSAIQRPWTVEFKVGALDGTLGTERASLLRNHELLAELAQYQAVRHELDEIGTLLASVSVDANVAYRGLPESGARLVPILRAKIDYWRAYRRYLDRFIQQTGVVAERIASEMRPASP